MAENSSDARPPAADKALEAATSWHLRTPEGPIYGPIRWDEVLVWAAEGRITADCDLAESAGGPWRSAAELIPHLPTDRSSSANGSFPATAPASGRQLPVTPYAPVDGGDYVAPHRGLLVLVLGLLGLCSCPLFSFIAWGLGSHDLREMRSGRRDRSGEGLTMAGMVLGMILSLVWMLAGVALLSLIITAIASGW